MRGTRIVAAVAMGGALCLVAGCGSTGSKATAGPPTTNSTASTAGAAADTVPTPTATPTTTATPTETPSGTTSPGGAVDVCTLMSARTLSAITGTTYTETEPDSTAGTIFSCNYTHAGDAQLVISVTISGGAIGYQSDLDTLHAMGSDPNPVTGVGDQAFSQKDPKGSAGAVGVASFASFGALFGDVFIQTSGLDYVTAAQGTQIADQIHAAL